MTYTHIEIIRAIAALRPGAIWSLTGDNIEDIVWDAANEAAAPTAEEIATYIASPPVTIDQVNAERDRRIYSGFIFDGVRYQSRLEDQKRIAGAGTLALAAIVAGAQPGDFLWHGGTDPFVWIGEDNSLNPMDAQTVIAFGQAAARHEALHVFAARALKDNDPIPTNYTDNHWWPNASV